MIGNYRHIESGQIVNVACTHLKSGTDFGNMRRSQVSQLINDLKNKPNLIVTGDFNEKPGNKPIAEMLKKFNLASGGGFNKKPNYNSYQRYYASRESMEKTILDYVFTKTQH